MSSLENELLRYL